MDTLERLQQGLADAKAGRWCQKALKHDAGVRMADPPVPVAYDPAAGYAYGGWRYEVIVQSCLLGGLLTEGEADVYGVDMFWATPETLRRRRADRCATEHVGEATEAAWMVARAVARFKGMVLPARDGFDYVSFITMWNDDPARRVSDVVAVYKMAIADYLASQLIAGSVLAGEGDLATSGD